MRKAAVSAGRTLRSALDTSLLANSPWIQSSGFGVSSSSSSQAKHENISRLSSRLSERLAPTGFKGLSAVTHTTGARGLNIRARKRRAKQLEAQKTDASRTKLNPSTDSPTDSPDAQTEWTAVSAALTSLEESIARTDLLLRSLASGEAWARRTRSTQPRLSWGEKATLDSSNKRKESSITHTTEALAVLLRELGQKQAVAVDLLSRLDRTTSDALPVVPPKKTFEDLLTNKTAKVGEAQAHKQRVFENGWGPDGKSYCMVLFRCFSAWLPTALAPPLSEKSAPFTKPLYKVVPIDETDHSVTDVLNEPIRGSVEPDTVSLECKMFCVSIHPMSISAYAHLDSHHP
jgi:hypothetical protein